MTILNSGVFNRKIEIYEQQETDEENDLGENDTAYVKIKELFARIETRIGGLLTSRPADTVLSTVTHKFSWRYSTMPVVLPNKHKIKYRDNWFNINYCLNDGFKDEVLEVFVTEVTG